VLLLGLPLFGCENAGVAEHDKAMTELWQRPALELAAMIRSREVSSLEVLEAHLARVEAINPALNAIVSVLVEPARAAAAAADQATADGRHDRGPLHGVPCTIKENIDVAGTPTTNGIEALADAIAERDAPIVERLRHAGAIPFARTNLPDLGLRIHTDSQLHGLTRNPWDPTVTAGGSSGGEAASLASGMSPLGFGNDIGGSLRNPAHCCGVASLKPSTGVVPSATVIPPLDPMLASQLMAVDGPMARRVADVRAAFEIIAGPDARDPMSLPVILGDIAPNQPLSIALLPEPPGGSTDPGISAAIRRCGDVLSDLGHDVVEAAPPHYEELIMLWAGILITDLRIQKELLMEVMGEGARVVIESLDAAAPPTGPAETFALYPQRHAVMRQWSEFFSAHPILISPTWALPAFEHDADLSDEGSQRTLETFRPVLAPNALGLPAAVVPVAVADGLPVGAQIIGDRFFDLGCLSVAQLLEDAFGTITPIDPRSDRAR